MHNLKLLTEGFGHFLNATKELNNEETVPEIGEIDRLKAELRAAYEWIEKTRVSGEYVEAEDVEMYEKALKFLGIN